MAPVAMAVIGVPAAMAPAHYPGVAAVCSRCEAPIVLVRSPGRQPPEQAVLDIPETALAIVAVLCLPCLLNGAARAGQG